jgi:hypothetical protein
MKARAIVMILAIVAVSAVFFSCDKEDFKPVSEKVELDEATPIPYYLPERTVFENEDDEPDTDSDQKHQAIPAKTKLSSLER